MSRIVRGTQNRARRNAKNFTQRQAQARLDETVPAFNRQVINSLFVNAVEIDYYQARNKIGRPCTCEKVPVSPHDVDDAKDTHVEESMTIPLPKDDKRRGAKIHLQDNDIFGSNAADRQLYGVTEIDVSGRDPRGDDDIPDALNYEPGDGNAEMVAGVMYGSNANCGICYRTGYQPGYTVYGKQRTVLTTWDVQRIEGYIVVTSDAPNSFKRQGPMKMNKTFVEFVLPVPKHFRTCTYSLRNNNEPLIDRPTVLGMPLSLDMVRRYAGKEMVLRVHAERFTHLVVEFDLGLDKIRANIGAETQALDYEKYEAISNFPVVMPPTIHEVNPNDVIVVRDRRLVLKVEDKERKITAKIKQLEWVVQTRLVQKTEPLRHIWHGIKLI